MAKDYFSHDYNARNDKQLTKLFMKHGLKGIGAYWCIVEMLYEESGYLELVEVDRIAFELRVDLDFTLSIIHEFKLFENDDIKFWSNSAIDRLNLRMEKSEKASKTIQKRWDKYHLINNKTETKKDIPQLYVLLCQSNDEKFIKIGITETTINRRFSGKMPYDYSILKQYFTVDYIELERFLSNKLSDHSYLPKINFGGSNECYDIQSFNILNNTNIEIDCEVISNNDVISRNKDVLRCNTIKVKESKVKESKVKESIYREFAHLKISIEENKKLIELGYNQSEINSIYDSIENYKKNTSYKSLYLTSVKWLKKEYPYKSNSLKPEQRLPLWQCKFNAAPTKEYECETEQEARDKYFNFGGAYPEQVIRLR